MIKRTSSSFEVIVCSLYIIVVSVNELHKHDPMGGGPSGAVDVVVFYVCADTEKNPGCIALDFFKSLLDFSADIRYRLRSSLQALRVWLFLLYEGPSPFA